MKVGEEWKECENIKNGESVHTNVALITMSYCEHGSTETKAGRGQLEASGSAKQN